MMNLSCLVRAAIFLFLPVFLYAEAFRDVRYLYKAPGDDQGQEIVGELDIDAGAKAISFQSYPSKSKKHPAPDVSARFSSASITSALYERASRPRYVSALFIAWPLIFTKGKKHFLTVQYATESGEGRYAVFHLDKTNYREILAAMEAAAGKKIERSEER